MKITVMQIKVPSCDGKHKLYGKVYLPEGEAKGYFHVVHGMAEHIERYDKFMREIANEGYIVFGYDHLGHGLTANNKSELGFIAVKNGWDLLLRDVKTFSDEVRTEYPIENAENSVPYILMGHSMGSFIVRLASAKYVNPDKLIIMGTGGRNPLANVGLALIETIKVFCGKKHISKLVNTLSFGSFNKKFEGYSKEDSFLWLSTDKNERQKYYDDIYCGFEFTVTAMGDLIRLMKNANKNEWFEKISKKMPMLIVSGEDDPVGNYGKGIKEVYTKLVNKGANAVMKLYKGARHEILNDFTHDEVVKDITEFINK